MPNYQRTRSRKWTPREAARRHVAARAELSREFGGSLPAEQRQKLIEKALEKKLDLEVDAVKAAQRHERSGADMEKTTEHIRDLERSTKADYTVKATYDTASGHSSVEVRKNNNTVLIVIAVAVAFIFFLLFRR